MEPDERTLDSAPADVRKFGSAFDQAMMSLRILSWDVQAWIQIRRMLILIMLDRSFEHANSDIKRHV